MSKEVTENERNLDKILKQKTNHTFKYLKNYFGLKTDYDLMEFLTDYFHNKLDKYNFESDVSNNKYLSKLIKYFGYSLGKIDITTDENLYDTLELLTSINNKIKTISIDRINNNSTKEEINNTVFLLNMSSQIESIISNLEKKLSFSNKIDIISEDKIASLIKDVVFNVKDIAILESILDNFPNATIIKDYDGKLIFEKILDRYYNNLVNKDDYYEKIYYDKVVDMFSSYLYLYEENIIEESFYKKMRSFITTTIYKITDNEKKKYILADLNERIKQFEIGNDIDFLDNKEEEYHKNIEFDKISSLIAEDSDKERIDMTDRHVITIDNNNAKLLENAISIESVDANHCRITIYAIDVSDIISSNRMKEKTKYKNILDGLDTTIFGTRYRYKHANLLKGKQVPVIAYQFLVDEDFKFESFNFKRAIIEVKDNLKFADFNNNMQKIENEQTKETINNLFELTYPYIAYPYCTEISETSIDDMLCVINRHAARRVAEYTNMKKLPIIYKKNNDGEYENTIQALEEKYNINLNFLRYDKKIKSPNIYTIGNDKVSDENELYLRLFSPSRRLDALINQMLINTYLVDHHIVNEYTKNYLESRLDRLSDSLNKRQIEKYYQRIGEKQHIDEEAIEKSDDNLDKSLADTKQKILTKQ